jgi:multidrug resistance efflux pump
MPQILEEARLDADSPEMQNIELRSQEVQELISNDPGWLVRKGISFFMIILLGVIAGAWFIRYPEIVNARMQLTSLNPPLPVFSRVEGKLIKLFATDTQRVKKNDVLGYIESTASHEEVIKLSGILDTLQRFLNTGQEERVPGYMETIFQNLGEMQPQFQTFAQSYVQFKQSLSNGSYIRRKSMIYQDIVNLNRQRDNLVEQRDIYIRDQQSSKEDYEAQKKLADDKVISPAEMRLEENKYRSKELPLNQIKSSLVSNDQSKLDKQKELMELDRQIAEQRSTFQQSLNTFQSLVEDWKKRYLLIAPADGKVVFNSIIQVNQYLRPNQELFFISPGDSNYYGEMYVSQFNLGKVKIGQEVLLKFPSYPFQEYGSVKGKIIHIYDLPHRDSGYAAKVSLPDGLVTNYKKQVLFRNGLSAEAEIITDDMRLAERLFYNFRKLLSNNK